MNQLARTRKFWRRDTVWPFLIDDDHPQINVDKNIILYIEDLTVSFNGFKALNNLSFYINDGELRCVIGANGAGKSTFLRILSGEQSPTTGSVSLDKGKRMAVLKLDHFEFENEVVLNTVLMGHKEMY